MASVTIHQNHATTTSKPAVHAAPNRRARTSASVRTRHVRSGFTAADDATAGGIPGTVDSARPAPGPGMMVA